MIRHTCPVMRPGHGYLFFLCILWFFLNSLSVAADPGFLWMEPGPEMNRSGGGAGMGMGIGRSAEAGKPPGGLDADGKLGEAGDGKDSPIPQKKPEKRVAMSHPAHYTIQLGWPPESNRSPEQLQAVEAVILRPDFSTESLLPRQEKDGAIRIRDAALLQGRYHVTAFLEKQEGRTLFRLFTRASMRNTGEKPETKANMAKENYDAHLPWFSIEDLSPDPGENFARIHRKYTGDVLPLKIRLGGEPVGDLPVTLITRDGWRRTLKTGADGEVCFTLIKESFQGKGGGNEPVTYFVTTEMRHDLDEVTNGIHEEVLRSSLALSVYPSPLDWESKSAGFYTLVVVSTAIGLTAGIRRRNRRRLCA